MKESLLRKCAAVALIFLFTSGLLNAQAVNSLFSSDSGIWYAKQGTASDYNVANGHLNVTMIDQGASYRNDLTSEGNTIALDPTSDKILAIKFVGTRPDGALKFEMKDDNGIWYNDYQDFDGSFSTNRGNTVYYWDLSSNATYGVATSTINIVKMNVIIADATTAPFDYSIDWIKIFESVYASKVGANIADDGSGDVEEELFQAFSTDEEASLWETQNSSTYSIASGHLDVTMADQGASYRGDLWYNYGSDASKNLGFNPSTDVFVAIKFIGTRPDGALKYEMQYENADGSLAWFNTQWNYGMDGSVSTSGGNTVYYFDLSREINYTGTNDILIRRMHFVVADAKAEPFSYYIDWVSTFSTIQEIESFKDSKDDGISDADENENATKVEVNTIDKPNIFVVDGTIRVMNCEAGAIVTVYDITGSIVRKVVATSSAVNVDCKTGLYIVLIQQGDSISTSKVLIE